MNVQLIIWIVVIIAVYYFLLIRPRQQESKNQASMVESLVSGTEIMTIGGIYGRVVEVKEDRVRIAVADGSELEIAKRAIGRVIPAADADADAGEPDGAEPPVAEAPEHEDAEQTAAEQDVERDV
jgi:preprotein translocase subunit YajC